MNDTPTTCAPTPTAGSSRRTFITRAAALSVVPLAAGLLSSRLWTAAVPATEVLKLKHWLPLIGTVFTVPGANGEPAMSLTLFKAEALKHHQPEVAEQFSLRFTPPAGRPFESRIYTLQHPVLGSLELFISPVGSAGLVGEMQKGEAIINCLCRPA